jgi:hypothetical protein
MQSHIYGATTLNPSTSATNFNWIAATNLAAWNATEGNRDTVIPHALTLDQLRVVLTTAPGSGKSYAFTVMKNGAATALTCTVSGTATSAQDLANTVSFAAGDTISLRAVPSGTPTAPGGTSWSIRQDAADLFAVIGGASQNPSNTATQYNGLMSTAGWNNTESNVSSVVPTGGTFKNLHILASAAPGAGTDRAFTLMVNGAASALTCALGASGTTASDTTNTVAVSAGDVVSLRSSVTGTPTAANVAWACSFDPTTDGESFLLYGDADTISSTSTEYEQPLGRGNNAWGTTEANGNIILAATTIKALYALLSGSPGGSGKSYTFTLRKNAADTTATVAIANTSTANNTTGLSVAVADDDKVALKAEPGGIPTVRSARVGTLLYIAPAGGGVTVSASAQSAALSQQDPTVATTRVATVTPAAQSAALSQQSPSVVAERHVTVAVGVHTLTASQPAPAVVSSQDATVAPGAQTIALTQQAPTVAATRNVAVAPAALGLAGSLSTPTVSAQRSTTIDPDAQTATASLPTPAASTQRQVTVSPTAQAISAAQSGPTVEATRTATISPLAQTLALSQSDPSIAALRQVTVTAGIQTPTLSNPSASVVTGLLVTVPAQSLGASLPAPGVVTERHVSVTMNSQSFAGSIASPAVAVTRAVTVTSAALSLGGTTPAPSVVIMGNVMILADPVIGGLGVPAVVVVAHRSALVSAGTLSLALALLAPFVRVGSGRVPVIVARRGFIAATGSRRVGQRSPFTLDGVLLLEDEAGNVLTTEAGAALAVEDTRGRLVVKRPPLVG